MSRYVLYINIPDKAMAKIEATADKIGFIGNHETIVDMNAKPVCSPLVIALNRYGRNGRLAVFSGRVRYAVLGSVC
jgi:hypothetical protein